MTDQPQDPREGQQKLKAMLRQVLEDLLDDEDELDHDANFFIDNAVELGKTQAEAELRADPVVVARERQILKDGYMAGRREELDDYRENLVVARRACEEATNSVWIWSVDKAADIQSFSDAAIVSMTGAQLRSLLAEARSEERRRIAPELVAARSGTTEGS